MKQLAGGGAGSAEGRGVVPSQYMPLVTTKRAVAAVRASFRCTWGRGLLLPPPTGLRQPEKSLAKECRQMFVRLISGFVKVSLSPPRQVQRRSYSWMDGWMHARMDERTGGVWMHDRMDGCVGRM